LYKKLLVPVSLADGAAQKIISTAKSLLANGGDIEVLYVADPRYLQFVFDHSSQDHSNDAMASDVIEKAKIKLSKICAEAGAPQARVSVLFGHPAEVIKGVADDKHCDLIVMGTHGRRGWRRVLGSVANEVLHGTPAHVFLCRSAHPVG